MRNSFLIILLLITTITIIATSEIVFANTVSNGNFETGTISPWFYYNPSGRDSSYFPQITTTAYEGTYAMKWKAGATRVYPKRNDVDFIGASNISFMVKSDSGSDILMGVYGNNNGSTVWWSSSYTVTTDWTKITIPVSLNGVYNIDFECLGGPTQYIYIDDIRLNNIPYNSYYYSQINGTVKNANGQPIQYAYVSFVDNQGTSLLGFTDQNGYYQANLNETSSQSSIIGWLNASYGSYQCVNETFTGDNPDYISGGVNYYINRNLTLSFNNGTYATPMPLPTLPAVPTIIGIPTLSPYPSINLTQNPGGIDPIQYFSWIVDSIIGFINWIVQALVWLVTAVNNTLIWVVDNILNRIDYSINVIEYYLDYIINSVNMISDSVTQTNQTIQAYDPQINSTLVQFYYDDCNESFGNINNVFLPVLNMSNSTLGAMDSSYREIQYNNTSMMNRFNTSVNIYHDLVGDTLKRIPAKIVLVILFLLVLDAISLVMYRRMDP